MRTIIVRLFEPAPSAGEVGLHGFIDDVACRTTERFTGADQLMAMFERIVRQAGCQTVGPAQDQVTRRLWDEDGRTAEHPAGRRRE